MKTFYEYTGGGFWCIYAITEKQVYQIGSEGYSVLELPDSIMRLSDDKLSEYVYDHYDDLLTFNFDFANDCIDHSYAEIIEAVNVHTNVSKHIPFFDDGVVDKTDENIRIDKKVIEDNLVFLLGVCKKANIKAHIENGAYVFDTDEVI